MKSQNESEFSLEQLVEMVSLTDVGFCEWNLKKGVGAFNQQWVSILGYEPTDFGHAPNWMQAVHPEDVQEVEEAIAPCLDGEKETYVFEARLRHEDGRYIWVKMSGKIHKRDANGAPESILAMCTDVSRQRNMQQAFGETVEKLEVSRREIEAEISERTKEVMRQDRMLWHVNEIAKRLVSFNESDDFEVLVQECLAMIGGIMGKSRVYIWKDIEIDHKPCCVQVYEWVYEVPSIQGVEEYENIPYENLPHFFEMIQTGSCLNSLISDLSVSERELLEPQGIQSLLVAPVSIEGKNWGFIGVDDCEKPYSYSPMEENMMLVSGFLLASAIQKHEARCQLQEIEELTQIMLNATPLCCSMWTRNGEILTCNEEAVRMFGLSDKDEFVSKFDQLSPPIQPNGQSSQGHAIQLVKDAFATGYLRFEWQHQNLKGESIPCEVILVRTKHKNDYIVTGYTRDLREMNAMLAEMQKVENDLRLAHEEALLSSKAKTNFLANMSHEIRTPMNAIAGLSEIIIRDTLDSETASNARGIKQACTGLLSIINDILDISKIESGKMEIVEAEYSLAELIDDVVSITTLRMGNKPILFVTDVDSHLPARLIGDEIRLKQIFINLLSNAVKFTAQGHIHLSVQGKRSGDMHSLVVSVTDSGQGIGAKDMKNLFGEFERVNTKKNRNIEGTGLGLAITKRLVEMMQGSITVDSKLMQGTTFTVALQQKVGDERAIARVAVPKRVLVCESRETYLVSLTKTIEELGCEHIACRNQSELLENIAARPYDFVLTSPIHLEKVAKLVGMHCPGAKISVIAEFDEALSTDENVATLYMPASCVHVANLLNHKIVRSSAERTQESIQYFTAPKAHILVVDDNEVNLQVAQGLLQPYKFKIDTAINGLEAIKKVQSNHYDLVLMDHMMPEVDGIDATIAIRKMEGEYFKSLPIVALTANAIVGTREMFLSEGMNDFLAKPVELHQLNLVLHKWIPQELQQSPTVTAAATLREKDLGFAIEGVDVLHGAARLGGDVSRYLKILGSYYHDGIKKLEVLPEYVKDEKFDAFRIDIHAVKGTSATIGAHVIAKEAKALEAAAVSFDIDYLSHNLKPFLAQFAALLKRIKPHVDTQTPEDASLSEKPQGSTPLLEESLQNLLTALEYAKIAEIERLLQMLKGYVWSETETAMLSQIEDNIAVFEYDDAVELAKKILHACQT